MGLSKRLLFVALVPPENIQNQVTEIKEYFAREYNSSHALKSVPHITLQPPFKWPTENLALLQESLETFVQNCSAFPITLSGFAAFPPRVIYINVVKTPELLKIQKDLIGFTETTLGIVHPASKTRPFSPHVTVAFRDLTKQNFRAAWLEFRERSLDFEFTASQLTLLIHNGKRWDICNEFPFFSKN
ncbi:MULTISPECIES: 2'-5' RNA ligase family protein [Okeania]|uniref:2'-5' RNA ligase family protein n=1 Tax=Okeania hirsuta TaxID=1458930 RepID=A0A3N6P0G4_9CYAN|nr:MULTISPECIES: 2'-5' RNA ligase family protein [Okeania]NEP07988.1 2'-5' RNA ligase family protein [Okeania sp. SIO4D6]NEP40109.1 2'-5' RNA ligase family protein [Okeania sp. SIO2H7]NEP72174.1 2'-5' RNA ligase family protein [Okeania sp. SIO2G5]NEP91805.1 2'-5' RNA ligase family protein [Okeania sp. SIO2F5]NEQ90787.1 2'-5' RNA ligase family protein [Okeania sp. SIO2G4]